jgi:SAM-dependent methyltransferase
MKRVSKFFIFLCLPIFYFSIFNSYGKIYVPKNWHENTNFWKDFEFLAIGEFKELSGFDEVENILNLVSIPKNGKILDLGCGTGRHAIEFALRGFNVTGVDICDAYLKKAKLRAKQNKIKSTFLKCDMRKFCEPKKFDCVVNLGSSFGYFSDVEEKKVIENIYRSLKNGGIFVMENFHLKDNKLKGKKERDWRKFENYYLLGALEISNDGKYEYNQAVRIEGADHKEYSFRFRLYSKKELVSLLKSIGFKSVKTYKDFSGDSFKEGGKKLVLVAKK